MGFPSNPPTRDRLQPLGPATGAAGMKLIRHPTGRERDRRSGPCERRRDRGRKRREESEQERGLGQKKDEESSMAWRQSGIHFEIASHPVRPLPYRPLFLLAPSLRKIHPPQTPFSLRALSLSFPAVPALLPPEGSVLASNTDIEQSPFSLKPSSHQE